MKSLTIRYNIHSRWSACFCTALLLLNAARLHAATNTVTIAGFAFQPPSLTISVGDTVRWVNQDAVGHTTTCDRTGDPVCGFSPLLGQGGSFQFTYTQPGTFPYHCSPHPFMRGTVTVQAANLPPLVAITTPTNGATFTPPALLTITANASDSDGTIRQVEFFAGALSIGVVTNAPYIYSIPAAAVPPGPYVLTARATDNLGLVATSAPVNVTVVAPNSPPTVSFTSPAEGAVFTPPMLFSMTARASDSDGSVRQVEFFASGIPLGVVTNSPYTYAAPAAVIPPGNYVLTARATDNQGATTTSAAVNVRVRPALAIGSASFAAPGQFRLNLTGAAGLAYVLETSSNLTSWLPVATNTASADDFTLTDAPGPGPRRFYRVRQLP